VESVLVNLFALLIFYLFLEDKMQRLTIVLLFGLLALASASSKFKRLTPIQPQPQCSLLEVEMCAGEIGGKRVRILSDFFLSFHTAIFLKRRFLLNRSSSPPS
jgi:hypothetical protein